MSKSIQFTIENEIGTIMINRPQVMNSITRETFLEMEAFLDRLPKEVRVLLIAGMGEKSFVSGADIKELNDSSLVEAMDFVDLGNRIYRRIEHLPIPVIAIIQGYCLGGGLELAMACDIRIASTKARFGQPEVGLGIIPGFGGSQRLPRTIGRGAAMELLVTGNLISAERAYQIGLVNYLVDQEELLSKTYEIADLIKLKSASAIAAVKESVNHGAHVPLETALAYDKKLFEQAFLSPDRHEGFEAYMEKRKPVFKERK